ncbi:long-chain-fatty-acid--CoA ligase [Paenibacillus sp. 481]|uniref:long-chain-fatty-acid--CoA ligase n=1 Tax=Paenibacillus sp. 481 TaxID=2835869 RepID=UPI001E439820|nr:long-chain-fatty-acid--CoA ligase [Paenibacillus sp. 481]UHA75056.1 long-chain-fatty-acid--CoA ligase [Paenibacillus sp. 481]
MPLEKPWLCHYPSEIASTYEYPQHNLARFLIHAARDYPVRTALYFMGKKINYEQLLDASYRFANVLTSLGVKRGDRVAIMLPNCPQTVIAYYGTLMIGAVAVLTNPLYKERELEHQLNDAEAKLIVTLDLLFPRVHAIKRQTELEHIIVTSIKDYLPFPKNVLYPFKARRSGANLDVPYGKGVLSFRALLQHASQEAVCVDVDVDNELALLQYTGGTTGVAKGVMLTHTNLIANTLQASRWFYKAKRGEHVFLGALPFFHVFGMTILMNLSIVSAGTNVLIPKFDAEEILGTIHRLKPTMFPGAPTMYIALINHPKIAEYDLSSIQMCISGASSLPLEVQTKFEKLSGCKLIEGYGLSESSPVTHANLLWGKRKNGTIGIPFPDTDAKVVDPETGVEMPVGEIGELVVQGPQVMKGYWKRPDETSKMLRDGWLYTGDMARMDEEGFFTVVDRKKDLIIAGGFNIYPREIEEVLFEHPHIQEASVIGVPDDYRGETVKAYIVLRAGKHVTEQELNDWCRSRLASYKVPRQYEIRSELPKTIAGKVLKRALLEEETTTLKQ